MALTGKLVADFASFYDAVNKAQVELKSFQGDANKVGDSLNRMANQFSGKTVIQQATLMVDAVEKIGGASQLTEREMKRLQATVGEAVEKMRAIGADVPQKFLDIANAAGQTVKPIDDSAQAFDRMEAAVGSFFGNLASDLLQKGISTVIDFGKAALESGGQIADMSKKLGISAEAVQGFQYAAEQSGTTIDAFGAAINKLNVNLAEGDKSTVKALQDLGLEFDEIRAMNPEQAFLAVTDALAGISDPMERARLGAELMGKGFAEISPAVQSDLRATADAASKMSNETVAALDEAGDALDRLSRDATIVAGSVIASFYSIGAAAVAVFSKQGWFANLKDFGAAMIEIGLTGRAPMELISKMTGAFVELQTATDAATAAGEKWGPPSPTKSKASADAANEAAKALERQHAAMEKLGLVTAGTVNQALAEFTTQQKIAVGEGVELNRVLALQLPKLAELVTKAKASGVNVEALAKAYTAAGDAWRRMQDFTFDTKGAVDFGISLGQTDEELERLTGGVQRARDPFEELGHTVKGVQALMSPEQWRAGELGAAMERAGVQSQEALDDLARQATKDYETIARAVGVNSEQARVAWQKMIDAQKRASGELPSYWDQVVIPSLRNAFADIGGAFSTTFVDMMTGAVGFKDGFVGLWQSIKDTFRGILADMLNDFVQTFLQGMIDALAKRAFGDALANWLGGGSGGGGGGGNWGGLAAGAVGKLFGGGAATIPNTGASLIPGLSGAPAGAAPAAGAPAAGVGAVGLGVAGGAAGALVLAYGISQKGWFRGGMEGIEVNPKRDAIFQSFVDTFGGTPYEAIVRGLESVGVVGESASALIKQLYDARDEPQLRAAYGRLADVGLGSVFVKNWNEDLYRAAHPGYMSPPPSTTNTVTVAPGAIVVNGVDKTPVVVAREIASALVDVIVRENPDGARTRLAHGLA